ncbi:MAG: phosphate/phosphite/phosphonate ABC transporter substrate-binding protein [Nannocystales bacterium]
MLRCVTYLAAEDGEPGLPRSLFAEVVAGLEQKLSCRISLDVARCGSGPRAAADDAFAVGEFDLGWVCAPSMLWLHAQGSVDLVPASMVLDDPRCEGRGHYWCEVIVRERHRASRVDDLGGEVAAFNDRASLSGFGSLLGRVDALGGQAYFGRWLETGSHARSVCAVREGVADVAAVDANVWRAMPQDGLRVLESLGPFPIQPMVVRRGAVDPARVAAALRSWCPAGQGMIRGFAPVSMSEILDGVPWAAMQAAWRS